MKEIAVLIPCYNEAQTIGKVVTDLRAALPEADIYVYDNNSFDDTALIAGQAGAIVVPEDRQGKGNVVRSMFRDIQADCYVMIDGDDTYPSAYARQLADLVLEGKADMVVGDRLSATYFTQNSRAFHNTGNRLVRFLINRFFNGNIKDIMSGYRAFSRRFVKTFPVICKGFEIETEMSIHALDKNLMIREIPVDYRDRPVGSESKLNTFKDGYRVLQTIGTLFKDYRPMVFFGSVSVILLGIGVGFFIPVLLDFFATGLVPKFPTLIVSIFSMLSGILSFFTGLILSTFKKMRLQQFEYELIHMEYLDALRAMVQPTGAEGKESGDSSMPRGRNG